MVSRRTWFSLLVILILAAACTPGTDQGDTPAPALILISEVQTGAVGDNNDEFIEVYNAGGSPEDLEGWTLTYRLKDESEEIVLFQWDFSQLIPPQGHLLLAREGTDRAAIADGVFQQALNTSFGGLMLMDPDGEAADQLGWGDAPASMVENSPAPSPENGTSLERLPGGVDGSSQDSNNNSADFVLNEAPDPQSSASPFTPAAEEFLMMELNGPPTAEPGQTFSYQLTIDNPSDSTLRNLRVLLPVHPDLSVAAVYQGGRMEASTAVWELDELQPGANVTYSIDFTAPWRYLTAYLRNARVQNTEGNLIAIAGSSQTRIEGGTLPVAIAREMIGEEVVIEGTATMYTGGYYAGSGVKFYLQDETGGVQVYVSGAGGMLDVPLGAYVRVRGDVLLYNNAIEVAPGSADDVEILTLEGEDPGPLLVDIVDVLEQPDLYTGLLVAVEGRATRIEEFSYSYEIDLTTSEGETLTLYVDKLTGINVEALDPDHVYQAIGIPDWRSTALYLNPRIDADLEEIYPPGVRLTVDSPASVLPGEQATVTLIVYNDYPETIQEINIEVLMPAQDGTVTAVLNGGEQVGETLTWFLASLEGDGASASVQYVIQAPFEETAILIDESSVVHSGAEAPSFAPARQLFVGAGVPIWAVQGSGDRSPYKLETVTVEGVVTGFFPDLGGFFIQAPIGDGDPATSDGLFVLMEEPWIVLTLGDVVSVTGIVRESSTQTSIAPASRMDIRVQRSGAALPDAIPYSPPDDEAASLAYNEPLEGMLVEVAGPVRAVAPTSQYGETVLVAEDYPSERVWRGEPAGMFIVIDDGSAVTHVDRSLLSYVITVGDQVEAILGPLAYTYGQYKIEPITIPRVIPGERLIPVFEPASENGFSIMTWNVENLFDILNPHPSSPEIPTAPEYQLDLLKIANTILNAGTPAIVALQEVENIGVLEDIAEHELLADAGYEAYLIEGDDSRGIDVGYLVRADVVTVTAVEQQIAPGELFARPPLLLEATISAGDTSLDIVLLNNHFLSLSAGEELTEPRRTAQAAWNGGIVADLLSQDPSAAIAVLGDLNSFYGTAPLAALEEVGLTHLYDLPGMEVGYSYIYQGVSQTLDHILISEGLAEWFVEYRILHVNADFPPPEADDPSPLRQSDHDPVVAWFLAP